MKRLLIFLSLTCSVLLQAQTETGIQSVIGKTFTYRRPLIFVELIINSNYTYKADYSTSGGGWDCEGSFTVNDGMLKLIPEKCIGEKGDNNQQTLGNAIVELYNDSTDLYFTQFIRLTSLDNHELLDWGCEDNNVEFGFPGKETPSGVHRLYKGIDVITMGLKSGITTSDVKIRDAPSLSGKIEKYWVDVYEDEKDFVPINEPIEIVARTPKKMKVQKWTNYWYLVNVGMTYQVWMFGEFVKFN